MENLNMGYCCINTELRNLGIFCSRTCRLETLQQNGIEYIYELAWQNINDLPAIFRWNYKNNIFLYRMSSEMFPFASHPDFHSIYDLEQFRSRLQELGEIADYYKQTLTFHPGQYNQLTSHRDSVVENSVIDINFHAKILDMMNRNSDSVIVIHGGSKNGGKEVALERFRQNFSKLSPSSQSRLVLENCEMAYTIEDLLSISEELYIPVVIDYHHHNINKSVQDLNVLTERILSIWNQRNITPLFHLSESRRGVKETDSITKRRAHSDYVQKLPEELITLLNKNIKINLDIEAKMKEQAVTLLLKNIQKYFRTTYIGC